MGFYSVRMGMTFEVRKEVANMTEETVDEAVMFVGALRNQTTEKRECGGGKEREERKERVERNDDKE